jgi:hypothetical protein
MPVGELCDAVNQDWHLAFWGEPPASSGSHHIAIVDPYPEVGSAALSIIFEQGGALDLLPRPR